MEATRPRRRRRTPRWRRALARVPWAALAVGAWWLFLAVVVPVGVWTLLGALPCSR